MRGTRNPLFIASLASFALLSAASGLRLSHAFDLRALQAAQSHASEKLDVVAEVLSLPGSAVVCGVLIFCLAVGLFVMGNRRLAIGLLIAFAATSLLEVSLKFLLPQVPIPEESMRITDKTPLIEFITPYPYPSGHMLRSTFLLGAVFALWKSSIPRILIVLVLIGVAWSLSYLGVHWTSDVIGGALLGIAGLAWAFTQVGLSAGQQESKAEMLSDRREDTWR